MRSLLGRAVVGRRLRILVAAALVTVLLPMTGPWVVGVATAATTLQADASTSSVAAGERVTENVLLRIGDDTLNDSAAFDVDRQLVRSFRLHVVPRWIVRLLRAVLQGGRPRAVDDVAEVAENDPPTPIDVLGNDTRGRHGPFKVKSVEQPAHGTVVITGGGTGLTYEPEADYCNEPGPDAPDTFAYTISGGSTGTVRVTVTCMPDDPDSDGLSDAEEEELGTDPLDPDTDNDGLTDGDEVHVHETDPLDPDTDDGCVADGVEVDSQTDPHDPTDDGGCDDPDGDGLTNDQEAELGTDPLDPDTDNDALTDGDEVHVHETDPLDPDTDDGCVADGVEIDNQANPHDPTDDGVCEAENS